jgi:hypothetical protein
MNTNGQSWFDPLTPATVLREMNRMKLKVTCISFCMILAIDFCVAQTNEPSDSTNWGKAIHGIQLSIRITNGPIEPGSFNVLQAALTNASTNDIVLEISGPDSDCDITLTNATGKICHLTPPFQVGSTWPDLTVHPAKQCNEPIWLTLGTNVERGDYTLIATRNVSSAQGHFRVQSNLVKITIK